MIALTGKNVKAFWAYMCKKYNCTVIDKKSADEMKIVAWFLDLMDITDDSEFLDKYATTIGRRIYVPFEIGKGNYWQLLQQVAVCVHECQHVVQYSRDKSKFVFSYLYSDAARTHYETDAMRCNMEMYWFFTSRLLSASSLANKLRYYGVGSADRRVAKKHLVISGEVVKRGGVVMGPSKVAIKWWKRRVPRKAVPKIKNIRI